MRVRDTHTITIAGAGLAGTLLAVLLARRNFDVELFERNPDPRDGKPPAGRSINLALAERGRHALAQPGLLDSVDRFTIPMRGRLLHDERGETRLQPYGKDPNEVIWSTHRERLNRTLLDAADKTGRIRMHFGHRLTDIDWERRRLMFGDRSDAYGFEVLLGADGGGSAVRTAMARVADLGVSEELLDHGYREFTIPPTAEGRFAMEPNALHVWPRGGYMLIALPNPDRSFTVTLFLPNQGDPSFQSLADWQAQRAFFERAFPDVAPLMPRLRREFRDHPVGLLGTIRCGRWRFDGRALLLGDAAHAIVPFHGQGMNAAFEDCIELARLVEHPDREWVEVFERFEERRKPNADAIADMALENYGIMREAVRDPRFLLRKSLEHELERRHPNRFIARYSLVMFHRIPYAEAQARGEVQARILDRLLDGAQRLENIDFALAERLVNDELEPIIEPG